MLFFLDEAVALAAGHRPCALCRRPAYLAYRESAGVPTLPAKDLDGRLHDERLRPGRPLRARPGRGLPTGAGCTRWPGRTSRSAPSSSSTVDRTWSMATPSSSAATCATLEPRARPTRRTADVLTPPTTVAALRGGYRSRSADRADRVPVAAVGGVRHAGAVASPTPDPGLWILHVDLDQYVAAVEIRRRPELRGLPVVVGGSGDPTAARQVVSTASYEARAFGVHSGMPLRVAARKCPDAVFLPSDHHAYDEASAEVMAVLRSFGHPVEVWGWDEAVRRGEGRGAGGARRGTALRRARAGPA